MSKFAKLLLASVVAFAFGAALAQDAEPTPTVEFTLHGSIGSTGFQFVGVGGDIDGLVNPDLNVKVGDVVFIPAGTYHGTASGETTWHGLTRAIFEAPTTRPA